MFEQKVGRVTHYFAHIQVAAIKLEDELKVGDRVHIKGHTSDFTQPINSMEYDHNKIEVGKKGQEVAVGVAEHARQHDEVFKVVEAEQA